MGMSIAAALIHYNEKEYLKYIDNHIKNVQKAWENMKSNEECMNYIFNNYDSSNNREYIISLLDDIIKHHDESKYGKEEFDAYRKEFYPISPEEKEGNKEALEKAWKHHYTENMHHWDGWYYSRNMDAMPLLSVIEMVCDWQAMSYVFGGSSKEWYEKNKKDIHLGEKQRKFAEGLMDIICK